MPPSIQLLDLAPTPLVRRAAAGLQQTARLTVRADQAVADTVVRGMDAAGHSVETAVVLVSGESVLDIEIPVLAAPATMTCELWRGAAMAARIERAWQPPRRWTVHLVQLSHHDVGYTDLASHAVAEHDRWLDAVIEMAAATRDAPEASRFRAVIEQSWSIDHYLRHARPERIAAMLALLRGGDLEVTALFGNMVTELCGHETLARCLYPAFRLKRSYGIPIGSAEHNDIPGFSWGLSQVLIDAGVQLICPGLPNYYGWGHPGAASFWDEAALFGAVGMPGAFWWQAPDGRRLLFWCNNQGCGGGCDPALPRLVDRLRDLEANGYPYPVLRWPVSGGARDNSPYIADYTQTVRDWNARWAWPRLVCSTNTRFHNDLRPHLPAGLPVIRGELPGQDYPVGAASTAAATAVNRRNHTDLPAAESLATAASWLDRSVPADSPERLDAAYEDVLWHDEHTWGHHFPAGPTAAAAELEKAVHAYRAAALTHDVLNKAMARIADAVRLDQPGIHLVVFNPLPYERSGRVITPLRELDNCGSTMARTEQGTLRGVLLGDRWHVNPPPDWVAGRFDLLDVATGETVPFQIDDLDSPLGPQRHAAQRIGLAAGGKRYGFFEDPAGLRRDLVFHAVSVPALGYRIYRLRPRAGAPAVRVGRADVAVTTATLENASYRLEMDPASGCPRHLIDKHTGRDLVATAPSHPFGAVLVRDPQGTQTVAVPSEPNRVAGGPVAASLRVVMTVRGHPRVEVTYTLFAREKRLDVSVALLKDPTPLLEVFAVFPFDLPDGRFRYEAPFSVIDPGRDLVPGAYADRLTVQNAIAVCDGRQFILWSSLDAPVVSLATLWPGRVSPAHSAVLRADIEHPRPTADDLRGGAIYSLLTANNFGTNLAVSQSGALLFHYSITSGAGDLSDAGMVRQGRELAMPLTTMFTKHPGPRPLPPVQPVFTLEPPEVCLLTLKRAESGNGWIVRLWNPAPEPVTARLTWAPRPLTEARLCNLVEEPAAPPVPLTNDGMAVPIPAAGTVTLRLT